MVVPDVDRGSQRAVGHCHDHRQSDWPLPVLASWGAAVGAVAGAVLGLVSAPLLSSLDGPPARHVLPLSTAYSICDFTGSPAALDLTFSEARVFYLGNAAITTVAAGIVLVPSVPLVTVLVSTQTLNAVLLVPLLVLMTRMARDRTILGSHIVSRWASAAQVLTVIFVVACVLFLVV